MQKNMSKTESVTEFLARGGQIKKVLARGIKKTYRKAMKEIQPIENADMGALPEALKIKYGIR